MKTALIVRANLFIAGICSVWLIGCGTYNKTKKGNPTYHHCAGYETTGYTTDSDTIGVYKLHGKVQFCKTGKATSGAHVSVKDIKDSIIAEAYTDKYGEYAVTYQTQRALGKIDVTSINGSLTIVTHDVGKFHLNSELNVRLYYVESLINEVPLTKDDVKFIKKIIENDTLILSY